MNKPLEAAMVQPAAIVTMSHVLAAANHQQWVAWGKWVLPEPDRLTRLGPEEVVARSRADGLDECLARNAETVIGTVGRMAGDFAYEPRKLAVFERKLSQFTQWVEYVASLPADGDDRTRWLLQCRTPFLGLTRQMQLSDYEEARKDLIVVAASAGLVLPQDLPEFKPYVPRHLRRLRIQHSWGIHGRYAISDQPWMMRCVGCHETWSVAP